METEKRKKEAILILGITFVLLLIGIGLRIAGIHTRNLEYDEIWTFSHYVELPIHEIFTDLATPNNHPLNSLFIKCFRMFSIPQLLQIRLPALFAGILLLIMFGSGLRRLTKSIPGLCFGVLLLALNIPLIRYSQTARGYEFQALFTTCVMLSLLFFELDLQSRFRRSLWAALFLISAAAACTSVTSGVIFVTALAFSYGLLFTDWRKWNDLKTWLEKKELWIAFLLFAVFVLLWYGLNYSTLAKGQTFGASVASPGRFTAFAWRTIAELPLTLTIPVTVAAAILQKAPFQRRIAFTGLLSTLLVFLSALIFKAGDPRVYIPLIPILALPAALIFDCPHLAERRPRLILPLFGAFLLIAGLQFKMRYADMNPPDMGGVFATAAQIVPPEALTIYSPTDSYIISCLLTKEFQYDQLRRIQSRPLSLLLINANSIGIYQEWTGNTVDYPIAAKPISQGRIANETTYLEYRLRPLAKYESLKNKFLIVLMNGPTKEQFLRCLNLFRKHFQTANIFCFLTMNAARTIETPLSRTRLLIYYSPEQSVEQMLALQSEPGSKIRFFVMEGKEAGSGR